MAKIFMLGVFFLAWSTTISQNKPSEEKTISKDKWRESQAQLNGSIKEANSEEKERRPNIVLILADDLGYSDIGSYGGEINTPNLDDLAYKGIRFTSFYNAARCCPTRASILTGLYPHQAGMGAMVYRNMGGAYQGYLNNSSITLAEVLKKAGYKTMMAGKWHVGHKEPEHWPTNRGFDRFYGINVHVDSYWKVLKGCDVYLDGELHIPSTDDPKNDLSPETDWYTTDVFTDYAIHFLNEEIGNKKDVEQPFFLYMAYNAPHFPLEAPDEDIARYRGKYRGGWEELRKEKLKRMKEMGIISPNTVLSPSESVDWDTLSIEDKDNLDFRRAIYAAQIDRMDQNIGRLVDHLKNIGEYENTLFLFLSDNGSSAEKGMFGFNWEKYRVENYAEWKEKSGWSVSQGQAWANVSNVPFRMYKKFAHEGGTATPLIMNWPNQMGQQGKIISAIGHVIDIMATVIEVADAEYPDSYNGERITRREGKSLMPLLKKGIRESNEFIYWEHMGNRAVRKGNWKLVALNGEPWELYDLQKDPTELINLIGDKPLIADELKRAYFSWAEKTGVRDDLFDQQKQ